MHKANDFYTEGFLRSIERDNQTQIITSRGPGF